jgi:hypothetical protein
MIPVPPIMPTFFKKLHLKIYQFAPVKMKRFEINNYFCVLAGSETEVLAIDDMSVTISELFQ